MTIDRDARYGARMITSHGELTINLDHYTAPLTVNNFVFLARTGFYDGLGFHRIVRGFMCQAGCPDGSGTGGPGYTIADELPKPGRYEIGSVAMANRGPDTNGSQFFIVSGPKGVQLPPKYSLFGKVIKGLDVIERIQQSPTDGGGHPREPILIDTIEVSERR